MGNICIAYAYRKQYSACKIALEKEIEITYIFKCQIISALYCSIIEGYYPMIRVNLL